MGTKPFSNVSEYVDSYLKEHGKMPTQRLVRANVRGQSSKVSAEYSELRKQAKYSGKNETKLGTDKPIIIGVTAESNYNPDDLWQAAFKAQDAVWKYEHERKNQRVILPARPVVIAILADQHFGSAGTDYRAAKRDAELVRDNPDVYAILGGDATDNFIIGKLAALNAFTPFTIDSQWAMFKDYLEHFRDKLIVTVAGNHAMWTQKLAAIDYTKDLVSSFTSLYDPDEIVFTLQVGDFEQVWKVRHKWKYGSIYNPTHAIEVGFQRGDVPFDIGVGAHIHAGTLIRPFIGHGKKRYACLTGAYKKYDKFSKEIGFNATPSNGCAAFVITPQGLVEHFDDIETAIKFRDSL